MVLFTTTVMKVDANMDVRRSLRAQLLHWKTTQLVQHWLGSSWACVSSLIWQWFGSKPGNILLNLTWLWSRPSASGDSKFDLSCCFLPCQLESVGLLQAHFWEWRTYSLLVSWKLVCLLNMRRLHYQLTHLSVPIKPIHVITHGKMVHTNAYIGWVWVWIWMMRVLWANDSGGIN